MFQRFFRRDRNGEAIAASLYGAVVAQARQPALYTEIRVPDTLEGRFEMVVLHLALLSRRMMPGGEEARSLGQAIFDLFCRDMDGSLRELGIGDLSVPRKMRQIGEAFFGRAQAYEPGLHEGDASALSEALRRNVWQQEAGGGAEQLAAYAISAASMLEAQSDEALLTDGPDFPALQEVQSKG